MENVMEEPKRIRWVNRTGTFVDAAGKKYKRGEHILASEEEIPTGFRDVICPLDQIPQTKQIVIEPTINFKICDIPEKLGWFNVINLKSGKPINEKMLREEDAKSLLARLN